MVGEYENSIDPGKVFFIENINEIVTIVDDSSLQKEAKGKTNGCYREGCKCCESCIYKGGHFSKLDKLTSEDIKMITDHWDVHIGFLREDGCALPREMRSFTCVRYVCDKFKK